LGGLVIKRKGNDVMKKLSLYNYLSLMPDGEELTVWDRDYDIETYFYSGTPKDKWDKAIMELSKILTVTEIRTNGVIVNLAEVIENNLEKLDVSDLFYECNIDLIMDDMDSILAGNVSEDWLMEFVKILK
jgi:hypothetical protein